MKKAFAWISAHLLAAFYIVGVLLTVLSSAGTAAWDGIGYATGRLKTETISLDTAQLENIVVTENGLYVSTTADPQMIVSADQPIRTIRWTVESETVARETEGYYAKNGGAFSLRARVFGKVSGKSVQLFFPVSGGNTVRIDPAETAGMVLTGDTGETVLYLNEPRSVGSYFVLPANRVFWLLLLPAVAAACADWLRRAYKTIQNRKKREDTT